MARVKNDNGKKFSKYVKSKTKTRDGVGLLKAENGDTIAGDKDMAKRLNEFFASVFTEEDTVNMPILVRETGAKLLGVTVTEGEIIKCIKT